MSFNSIKPFFLIAIAIAAALGICVALSVVWAIAASLLFLLSVSVLLIKKPNFSNYLIVLIFVFLLFGVRTYFQVEKNKQDVESWIHGAHRYDDFIKQTSASSVPMAMQFFVLDTVFASSQSSVLAESVSDGRRVLIQLNLNSPRLFYGDVVEIRGAWSYPRPTRNPGVVDTQKRYLYAGISGKVYPQTMVKVDHRLGNPIKQVALYLKERVLKQHKNSLPYPYSDLLTSFIFGESGTVLPDDISENFQRTGLTHVLVVSGAQVTLLCGIVFRILTFFSLGRGSSTAIMGSVCAVFYFLSGAGTSVLRAVVMAMVALGFQLFYYRASVFHIISFTFLLMAFINPFLVMDIGAQLSFMATFSLVFGSRTLEEALPLKWPGWLRIGVAVSIAPFLFTSPIILYHFHRVSVVSVVTNFLSMQIVEWVVVIGFFSTAIGFASFYMADVLNHGLYYLLFVLNMGTKWVSESSLAVWHIPMGVVAVFLWYGVLLVTFYAIRLRTNSDFEKSKKVFKGVILFCVGGFCLIFIWGFFSPEKLRVISIDVGQGDSTLILTPGGHSILIDAGPIQFRRGGAINAGEKAVLPVLNYFGVNVLDLIIVTHFHMDHVGGIPYILEHVPVKEIWDNSRLYKSPKSYLEWVAGHSSIRREAMPGVLSFSDGVTVQCLYPDGDNPERAENDASVAVKISYQTIDFLFTGDLEAEGENQLVSRYGSALQSEVLKLGHHGSKTSSTQSFLDMVQPRWAVASVGEKNRYGHPSKEIVSRLEKDHITLFRTDKQGAVFFETDGKRVLSKTFLN